MSQITYGVLGLTAAVLVSLSFTRSYQPEPDGLISNEVVSQMLFVGKDVVEEIAGRSLPFDGETVRSNVVTQISDGVGLRTEDLTEYAEFGGCRDFAACSDLDDFDGLSFVREIDGTKYEVALEVRYVEVTKPYAMSLEPTFAKQMNVLITCPSIIIGDGPLTVGYARIFTFDGQTGSGREIH